MLREFFDNSKPYQSIADAQSRVLTLKHVLAGGASVGEQLRQAEEELESLRSQLPRGDSMSFCVLCFFIALFIALVYLFPSNPMITELWRTPENPYLQQFRGEAAWIWRTCQILSASLWFPVGAVALLLFSLGVQRCIDRRSARMLLWTQIAVAFLMNGVLVLTFIRLLEMPLG